MLTFLTGFIASVAHVATGPDHLAAVAPLAIDSRKRSWVIGLSWGIGHTLGMMLIGLLFILFKEFLPVEVISKNSDMVIGFLLIGIGSWAIYRTYRRHSHGNKPHTHFHTQPYLYAHVHKLLFRCIIMTTPMNMILYTLMCTKTCRTGALRKMH
jgi:hypothetical protein